MAPVSNPQQGPDGVWRLDGRRVYVKTYTAGQGTHRRWRSAYGEGRLREGLPGVPRLLAIIPVPAGFQVVNEWIEGVDLAAWLRTRRSRRARLDVACQLVRLVQELVARRILHRDIKPTNIVITPAGKAFLVDAELMVEVDDPDPGDNVGTSGYASPEQVEGNLREDSDLPALSAVLGELLTGEPWPRTPEQRADEAQNDAAPPGEQRVIPVDPELDTEVFKAQLAHCGCSDLVATVLLGLRSRSGRPSLRTVLRVLEHEKARERRLLRRAAQAGALAAGLLFSVGLAHAAAVASGAHAGGRIGAACLLPSAAVVEVAPELPECPEEPGGPAPAKAAPTVNVARNVTEVSRRCGTAPPTRPSFGAEQASVYRDGVRWVLAFRGDPRRLDVSESETFTVPAAFACAPPEEDP